MARQKGKVTTKPPREPPPSKLKAHQQDVSSDAKPVSKPATGSETARTIAVPSQPPPVHPYTAPKAATAAPAPAPDIQAATAEPGPVTTAALSTILEEQESQIETNQEIDVDDEDLYVDHPSVSSEEDIFSGLEPLDIKLPAPSDQMSKARVVRKVGKGASKAAFALPHTYTPCRAKNDIANLKETIHLILSLDAIPAVKHPPLVTHIKHDPAKLCFALDTDEDWEALKDE
ncbi:hypothetical protein JB92DRAFT_3130628 [Gautieria morchelliformis]|nr:hypothetical protein JB92DRAFT_3130628 [Gautieria morchelliformis]